MPCWINYLRMSERLVFRPLSGIFLLDKATGLSSNAALQRVRRLFRAEKAGHTGSLDPLASGLLPICLGEATKLAGFLLDHDKRYQVRIRLGITTTTGDAEGEVLATAPVPALTEQTIQALLARFQGETLQTPPMYSALRYQGQRLYELARRGIEVERPARPVTLHEIHLLAIGADSLELAVHCSKGTYIRTLAEDIGTALGCGGHVTLLRRTGVGDLTLTQACTESALAALSEDERLTGLLAPDAIVKHIPAIHLSDEAGFCVSRGQTVPATGASAVGTVRLYVRQTRFLGMGEVRSDGYVAPRRLLRCFPQDGNHNGLKGRDS